MPCLDTHDWKSTSFIGAFLNLFIAYLFLCTSLSIHLLLRFLGFLGFSLPRFHNGRFSDADIRKCLQEGFLMNCASERISSVDRSIKSKTPFGSTTSDDDSNRFVELKLVRKNNDDISNARVKDETEDVSREEEIVNNNGFNLMTVQGMKGKRFVTRRSRNGVKSHRRGRVDCRSLISISSSENFDETVKPQFKQPYDVFIRAKDERFSNDDRKDGVKTGKRLNLSHWPESEKAISINEQVNFKSSEEKSFIRNREEKSVKELEEALKEERAARAAVCVELDEERNTAASAADEAYYAYNQASSMIRSLTITF